MIYGKVELHNIAEVRESDGIDGVRLQRVPESVRSCLSPGGQRMMLVPACSEIRFICDGPADVTLASEETAQVQVFYGSFQSTERYEIGREPVTIGVEVPERLRSLPGRYLKSMPFSPRVCRLVIGGPRRGPVIFQGAEGENVRPPSRGDLPAKRYLAYGTSITQGAHATWAHLSYAGQTAIRLGVDLINLGSGGSAFCEFEMADFIAGRDDWDFATLAMSVNMIGGGFSPQEFRERTAYMIDAVAGARPERPVVCITIFPHVRDFISGSPTGAEKGTSEEFRKQLREAVAECGRPNVHLIEGPDLLEGILGLTPDLVHPGDHGMTVIAENLAERLRGIVGL